MQSLYEYMLMEKEIASFTRFSDDTRNDLISDI